MKRPLVLVIDDSANIRRLLLHNLGKRFDVLAAESARAALDLLEEGRVPDLMIVDVAMPGMDGFSFVEQVKGDPFLKAVPVVMLTARDKSGDKERGLRLGADDYLTKPFNTEDLTARIENLLGL